MRLFTHIHLLLVARFFATAVLAGHPSSGTITLINATPYDWKLTSTHSYQLDWKWPKIIPAGTSLQQYVKFKKDHHDDAAEVSYSLVSSPLPASFAIKARPPKHIEVHFQDTLSSINNPEHSVINLGWVQNGDVSFVLSGDGHKPYISTNPPVGWMQSTLSTIGDKSLREISMPASHDSGMNKITHHWLGKRHNTVTQKKDVYEQLRNGARSFDIRPVYYKKTLYTGHFSAFLWGYVGGTGRSIQNVVQDINRFNAEYPGELIIVDISHEMNAMKDFRGFTPQLWAILYRELAKVEALWVPATADIPTDLSTLPLSAFISPRSKSAVLVRLPNGAPLPDSSIRKHKRKVAMATFAGATKARPGDGMAALGPALEDDDNDRDDHDSFQPTSGDNSDDADQDCEDSPSSPTEDILANSAPVSMSLIPIPTTTPTPDNKPVEIPATVVVPVGNRGMAFFHESRFPISGAYSESENAKHITSDQLAKLSRHRPSPHSDIHRSTWIMTQGWQSITSVASPHTSIKGEAEQAHKALFGNLWGAMSRNTYPNMIEVDDIHDLKFAALCMAINDHFASSRISPRETGDLTQRTAHVTAERRIEDLDESRGVVKSSPLSTMDTDETVANALSLVRIQYQA